MAKIVLDLGHGGTARLGGSSPNNASGPDGLLEKTVALDLAFRAERLLAARGHTVIVTRRGDNNVGLADRARAAKSIASPVFVSIHLNGFNNRTQGTETICNTDHGSQSADLCRAMQKRLVAATGHADRNASHPGGVKRLPLGVLKRGSHHRSTACCLVEISFMDVADEERRLTTQAYLGKVAAALADGVTDYLEAGRLGSTQHDGVFEDGFTSLGGRPRRLPRDGAEAAQRRRGKKRPADPRRERAGNDVGEFRSVDIGEGFDPESRPGETKAELESAGFDMPAFRSFLETLRLRHFSPEELLFLGDSNGPGRACAGRNRLPPRELWGNIANTARMLDEIRHRLGERCRTLSVYRNGPYNNCVGGESASLHMKFNAIDFRCVSGNSSQWHAVAKAVRASSPDFKGGIGKYASFIHIDTRGRVANW